MEKIRESNKSINNYFIYNTLFGDIILASDGEAIIFLLFKHTPAVPCDNRASPLTDLAAMQLEEYFSGKRLTFDLPLRPHGTAFQLSVWDALLAIPYGETRSYKEIAQAVGNPNACRAVGLANNRNPISIFIPCHRVIGSDGSLTGYGGGLEMKKRLLMLEQSIMNSS